MLTENEARILLAKAAATIEVPPNASIAAPPGRRRRWLVPAIAVATVVVLVAAGAALLRGDVTSERPPVTGQGTTPNPVTPTVSKTPEPDPDPDGVGARFLAYARGISHGLPVASRVRLYLGNKHQKTIAAADIADLSSWDVCTNYAERECPMSAVRTLRELSGRPMVSDSPSTSSFCPDTLAAKPTHIGGTHVVVLSAPDPRACMDGFEVQIWSNDAGQVTAVNLLFGSP